MEIARIYYEEDGLHFIISKANAEGILSSMVDLANPLWIQAQDGEGEGIEVPLNLKIDVSIKPIMEAILKPKSEAAKGLEESLAEPEPILDKLPMKEEEEEEERPAERKMSGVRKGSRTQKRKEAKQRIPGL